MPLLGMDPRTPLAVATALTLLLAAARGQACSDQGSRAVAAAVEPGPLLLGCAGLPWWPVWHLLTPPHRAPAPMPGFDPGNAAALPRLLVTYRCTGFLFVPVLPTGITTMGYVIDRPALTCPGLTP
jgi:hypothetical protein